MSSQVERMALSHTHEPTDFWYPCFLCERRTYLRQLAELEDQRRLKVMEAHVAAYCPDRDNCWARDIHDEHSPRRAASGETERR